ncbi:MAG: RNA methyltransferase [bacterium]|jgi:TrmH family RNA methyltransferase|nr:RNA methyltransferase [bacterium]
MSETDALAHIRLVLVEPKQPGNIGSVARAMKNMGLSRLYLVNPADHVCGDARAMAHGSGDILYGATVTPSLEEALKGTALVVGTSHRVRRGFNRLVAPAEAIDHLLALPQGREAALVFGREQNGFTNDEMKLCQIVSRIPSAVSYPSLNLSQAVLIYGYELFQAVHRAVPPTDLDLVPHEELELMYDHIQQGLDKLGFVARHDPRTFMHSIRRIFDRTQMERRDVATIHQIFRQIDRFISRHGLDPSQSNDPQLPGKA